MKEQQQQIIDRLIAGGGMKRGDLSEFCGYERFKAALRNQFGWMVAAEYDAAIKAYSERWM